jgi:hypothetical protein
MEAVLGTTGMFLDRSFKWAVSQKESDAANVGRRRQLSTKRKVSTRVLRTLGLSRFEETCCTELLNNRHIRRTTKKKIVSRQIGKENLRTSKESCVMVKLT